MSHLASGPVCQDANSLSVLHKKRLNVLWRILMPPHPSPSCAVIAAVWLSRRHLPADTQAHEVWTFKQMLHRGFYNLCSCRDSFRHSLKRTDRARRLSIHCRFNRLCVDFNQWRCQWTRMLHRIDKNDTNNVCVINLADLQRAMSVKFNSNFFPINGGSEPPRKVTEANG